MTLYIKKSYNCTYSSTIVYQFLWYELPLRTTVALALPVHSLNHLKYDEEMASGIPFGKLTLRVDQFTLPTIWESRLNSSTLTGNVQSQLVKWMGM